MIGALLVAKPSRDHLGSMFFFPETHFKPVGLIPIQTVRPHPPVGLGMRLKSQSNQIFITLLCIFWRNWFHITGRLLWFLHCSPIVRSANTVRSSAHNVASTFSSCSCGDTRMWTVPWGQSLAHTARVTSLYNRCRSVSSEEFKFQQTQNLTCIGSGTETNIWDSG